MLRFQRLDEFHAGAAKYRRETKSEPTAGMPLVDTAGPGWDVFVRLGWGGWKLHLAVSPWNRDEMDVLLRSVGARYKQGGSDQVGKDFTIYVGDRDTADAVAHGLERAAHDLIDRPHGSTTRDNRPFTTHIAGRFNAVSGPWMGGESFHMYGPAGLPMLHSAFKDEFFRGPRDVASKSSEEEHFRQSFVLLSKLFGDYFLGTRGQGQEMWRSPELSTLEHLEKDKLGAVKWWKDPDPTSIAASDVGTPEL